MEDKEKGIQNNTSKYNLIKVKTNKGVDAFIINKEFYFRFELQTKNNKQFLIYKFEKIAIFQSELQSKLKFENYSDIFIDGTFFSTPKGIYQIIIIRVAVESHHKYFTTFFTLSSNKTEDTLKKYSI